jgi:hypothetical protein
MKARLANARAVSPEVAHLMKRYGVRHRLIERRGGAAKLLAMPEDARSVLLGPQRRNLERPRIYAASKRFVREQRELARQRREAEEAQRAIWREVERRVAEHFREPAWQMPEETRPHSERRKPPVSAKAVMIERMMELATKAGAA